jgi:hypothetical protein
MCNRATRKVPGFSEAEQTLSKGRYVTVTEAIVVHCEHKQILPNGLCTCLVFSQRLAATPTEVVSLPRAYGGGDDGIMIMTGHEISVTLRSIRELERSGAPTKPVWERWDEKDPEVALRSVWPMDRF